MCARAQMLNREKYGAAVDIWSAGVVLYTMLRYITYYHLMLPLAVRFLALVGCDRVCARVGTQWELPLDGQQHRQLRTQGIEPGCS